MPSRRISFWKSCAMHGLPPKARRPLTRFPTETEPARLGGVVAQGKHGRHVLTDRAEAPHYTLAHALGRPEAGAVERRLKVDALDRAVVDSNEDRHLPVLHRDRRRHVGAQHRAVVGASAARCRSADAHRESVLAYLPPRPHLRGPDALVAQPRPNLAIASSMKRAIGEHHTDLSHQCGIRHRALWSEPTAQRVRQSVSPSAAIGPGPRHVQTRQTRASP